MITNNSSTESFPGSLGEHETAVGVAYCGYVPRLVEEERGLIDYVEVPVELLIRDPRASELMQHVPIVLHCASLSIAGNAPPSEVLWSQMEHWIQAKEEGQDSRSSGQSFKGLAGLERTLYRAATAEMTSLEHSLNWLATTGSVTPFIGLFGTVVGIINAFQGLGQGGTTTIQAVAPGISEALVATAAGLFAAIPAVIAYNHFLSQLKVFGVKMDDFTVELLNLIERSFS